MSLRRALLLVPIVAFSLPGCGGDEDGGRTAAGARPSAATSPPAAASALPALARRPPRAGEFVARGESSPATHGPWRLDGTYVVRFEQYAPEDPRMDFTAQTAFSAVLARRSGDPRGSVQLFVDASRRGRRTLKLSGRYALDVNFGDFPYVVRFTPAERS
jgi:hypothetical protein